MADDNKPHPEEAPNTALSQLIDFGALAAFMIAYFASRFARGLESQEALLQATWVLVVASAIALILGYFAEKRLAPLPMFAGGLALAFGILALVLHDPNLLKIKVTIQNALMATVLLGALPFGKYPFKYLLRRAIKMTDVGWRGLTLRYGLYFAAVAVVNEVVWRTQGDDAWVAFRGGLWIASAAFGIWQVFFILKHAIKDEDETAEPVSPDTGL